MIDINQINRLNQARDLSFIEKFCQKGAFMDTNGDKINGVCRPIDANELLKFNHVHDSILLEYIEKALKT